MSKKDGITIILSGVNDYVHGILDKNGFNEILGKENICENINIALEKAKSMV
jgi:SulP family sulfate permease